MKRKIIALTLALALLLPGLLLSAQAAPAYTIGNPYESVDWAIWQAYKTQLHVHTNGSDGSEPLDVVVEEHYSLGYDILAITDHMTLGMPWDQMPRTVPIARLIKYDRTKMAVMQPISSERRQEIFAGVGRDGRGMLEITRGVELNGAVPGDSHLQGFFSDFGQGFIGMALDYETPVRRNAKDGGLTVINHIGNTSGADKSGESFYDDNPSWIDKFGYLFVNYPSCIGMDINSGSDDGTKFDKILYDEILAKTIPYGVVPWAFTYSDAHTPGQFDRAWTVHLMPPGPTEAKLRKSMEDGTFFGFSRHARLERGDDSFVGVGDPPVVSHIAVDNVAGTISITASSFDTIVWTSMGEEVARVTAPDLGSYTETLSIPASEAKIGSYVRAYLLGPGGILYIQPFTVLRDGQTLPKENISRVLDYSIPLGWISAAFDFLANYTPVWFIRWIMVRFDPYVDLPWIDWESLVEG